MHTLLVGRTTAFRRGLDAGFILLKAPIRLCSTSAHSAPDLQPTPTDSVPAVSGVVVAVLRNGCPVMLWAADTGIVRLGRAVLTG